MRGRGRQLRAVVLGALLLLGQGTHAKESPSSLQPTMMTVTTAEEIPPSLRKIAGQLMASLTGDKRLYPRLVTLCDTFGPRLSGSENLERALDWILAELRRDGFSSARGEPVLVPRWTRGEEQLSLLTPQPQRLSVLGLGGSVATPAEGVSAPVVVVQSFAELSPELARDKIVLFAPPFSGYESGVLFRLLGAQKAALAGARAALLR
ncbi:MAG: hypothetical protein KAY55_05880, partial [Deltaproteobacteria bacterium]|nr:hypothetical protein [Deltaproteobacteria bacterium]